jgi:3D (Asp-Asp-Asp) domain-containing protein/peptidoglycan hydrolase CwlO-like protein
MRSRTARFSGVAAVLTLMAASAALAAPGGGGRARAAATTRQLDTRRHQALLGLYALDSRLGAWRSRLASLERAATALRQRRASVREELVADRATLHAGQQDLALDLRALYERGNVNPVAVMLGAESLTKGLRQLDDLSRVADQSRQLVAATTAARRRLLTSQHRLAAAERRLERSLAAARQAERNVEAALAARRAYISSLQTQEQLHARQVRSVEAAAQAARQKSQRLQPPAPPPPTGKRQLVVSATCYDLSGTTATGVPAGPGVVAVDPSVIPLGTNMYVPGYGKGVAADVGGGIKGDVIDLWMTPAQCASWGRRTVTITLYQ